MDKLKSLQEYQGILSLGYVYLIVMGILKESLYYNQLDINILEYSSITDVLLSPISGLTGNGSTLFIFFGALIFVFIAPGWLAKKRDKKWFNKVFTTDKNSSVLELRKAIQQTFLIMLSIGLLAAYIGFGHGRGVKIANQIAKKNLEFNDILSFSDRRIKTVSLLGKNGTYLFYVEKGESDIKITPIHSGLVQSIVEND